MEAHRSHGAPTTSVGSCCSVLLTTLTWLYRRRRSCLCSRIGHRTACERAAARRELCAMCGCLFSHSQLSRRHLTGVGEPTGARCKVDSSTCSGAPRKSYRRPPAPHTAARISPLASLASWRAAGQSAPAELPKSRVPQCEEDHLFHFWIRRGEIHRVGRSIGFGDPSGLEIHRMRC
jgi:hypothetical protein